MSPTVSIIVVNYNGEQFLSQGLESILTQSRQPDEVIVVDNASRDRSLPLLESQFKGRVRVIPMSENVGFPAACNRGVAEASGDLVALLNNDIILDSGWLENLLNHTSPPWDFWASQIVFASDTSQIDSAGDGMAVVGSAYKIGHGDRAASHQRTREVFGPCAAAALYRRRLLLELGGFDADFFLIYEDADLNLRARLRGHRCLYVAEARAVHRVNASIGTLSYNYVFYGHRNSEYVFWKNMPAPLLLLYLPERLLFNAACFFFFLAKGRGGVFLRAKWDFLRHLKSVLRKRRQIQRGPRIRSRELNRLLDRNWLRYRRNVVGTP